MFPTADAAVWAGALLLYQPAGSRQPYGSAWLYRYLRIAIPSSPPRHLSVWGEVARPAAQRVLFP